MSDPFEGELMIMFLDLVGVGDYDREKLWSRQKDTLASGIHIYWKFVNSDSESSYTNFRKISFVRFGLIFTGE